MNLERINKLLEAYAKETDPTVKKTFYEQIVGEGMVLVKKIAYGLARRNTDPVDDLVQVGSMGLLKAIEKFNPAFGANFKTYATSLITGEIRHYIRDKSSIIKAPREYQELSFRINQIIIKLTDLLGREPTDDEIAEELDVPTRKIEEAYRFDRRKQMISLDHVITGGDDGEQVLLDKIVDSKYNDYLLNQEDRIMLSDAIEILEPQMKEVIKLTYFQDLSQAEISKLIGISQMQVSRRLRRAISSLMNIICVQRGS